MDTAYVALAPAGRIPHERAPDCDVVGLKVAEDVAIGGLAAVFLAVGNHVDDAAATLGPGRELLCRGQNGVVEGVNFLGNGDKGTAARRAAGLQVGVGAVAVHMYVAAGH